MGILDQILLQGDDSLLRQELVQKRGFAGGVGGGINLLGNMFNYNGPMLWMASLIHDAKATPDQILSAFDSVIAQVSSKPLSQADLDRAIVKWRSGFYDNLTQLSGFGRADLMASFALFDDDPSRINTLEAQFHKVTPELLQKTAQEYLRSGNRTILELQVKPKDAPKSGL